MACLSSCPVALAGWSHPVLASGGPGLGTATVAFDGSDTPWLAWSAEDPHNGPHGVYVGHLLSGGRVAGAHRLSGTVREFFINTNPRDLVLTIDTAGFAVLGWSSEDAIAFGNSDVSAVSWHLGEAPSAPINLTEIPREDGFGIGSVSIATNHHGLTEILYRAPAGGPKDGTEMRVARFSDGGLGAEQSLQRPLAATQSEQSILSGGGGGFRASWESQAVGLHEEEEPPVGLESSVASTQGQLAAPRPGSSPPGSGISGLRTAEANRSCGG